MLHDSNYIKFKNRENEIKMFRNARLGGKTIKKSKEVIIIIARPIIVGL